MLAQYMLIHKTFTITQLLMKNRKNTLIYTMLGLLGISSAFAGDAPRTEQFMDSHISCLGILNAPWICYT